MIKLDIAGIGNAYDVDGIVWRGAQPEDTAWKLLAGAGCKTVIDLNNPPGKQIHQSALVRDAGMVYIGLDWSGIVPPTLQKVVSALSYMDLSPHPVFVHCQHGSDRTGTLCACWRMHHDNWSFDQAMEEAFTSLGLNGMHEFWMAAAVADYAKAMGFHV